MLRGTTPTHNFDVDIDTAIIKELKITYSQKDIEVLSKKMRDCTILQNRIVTRLSQEDTFLFECNQVVNIQMRVLTTSGDVLISEIMRMSVGRCLDDEVLV